MNFSIFSSLLLIFSIKFDAPCVSRSKKNWELSDLDRWEDKNSFDSSDANTFFFAMETSVDEVTNYLCEASLVKWTRKTDYNLLFLKASFGPFDSHRDTFIVLNDFGIFCVEFCASLLIFSHFFLAFLNIAQLFSIQLARIVVKNFGNLNYLLFSC